MITVQREAVLPVSIDTVWTIIESPAKLPEWYVLAEKAKAIEGSGIGRQQQISGRWDSDVMEIDQVVTEYEPPRLLAWKHVAERLGGKPAPKFSRSTKFTIRLQALNSGTHIQLVSEQEPSNFMAAVMMRLFGARQVGQAMEQSLKTLEILLTKNVPYRRNEYRATY